MFNIIDRLIAWGIQLRKNRLCAHKITLPVPVIIVGNITMGGMGKTPVVCALVQALKKRGYIPGVVSRGYKAKKSSDNPCAVNALDCPDQMGDEPVLIARNTQVPVMIGKNRVRAAQALLKDFPAINIIICDDGLQHYALDRDIEIALVNDNHHVDDRLFPMGSLREPVSRLRLVDFVLEAQKITRLDPMVYALDNSDNKQLIEYFHNATIYAVAGIAHPSRFFNDLRRLNTRLTLIECPYSDHYAYSHVDLEQYIERAKIHPVIMTEKDAVKFQELIKKNKNKNINKKLNIWVAKLITTLPENLVDSIIQKIGKKHGSKITTNACLSAV